MLSRVLARRAPAAAIRRQMFSTIKPGHEGEIRPAFNYVANPSAGKAFIKLEEETIAHAASTASLWYKVSLFIVVPVVIGTAYHTYVVEQEHFAHHAAHPRPSDDELPPEYEYQNVRRNKFFWGDGTKTLFWNNEFNHKKAE